MGQGQPGEVKILQDWTEFLCKRHLACITTKIVAGPKFKSIHQKSQITVNFIEIDHLTVGHIWQGHIFTL